MTVVLILGSGPNVTVAKDWPRDNFDRIVAINNAWQVRPDWDDCIHPEDFTEDRRPLGLSPTQRMITYRDYVPAQNALGGFVYGGGTMAFTAAYWALHSQKPRVIAMMGCDMVYPDAGKTHFYGTGAADPLRVDPTLRSLEAKSARLMVLAAQQGCAMVNLSKDASRLVFPRAEPTGLSKQRTQPHDLERAPQALQLEAKLGYMVPSGRYWKEAERFDVEALDQIDDLWLKAARVGRTTP